MSGNNQNKRADIKDRITTAQARNQEREGMTLTDKLGEKAAAAKDEFTAFAKEHPVATIAGGIAIGVLISAMFRNSPTRKAGRYAGARAAGLAAIGSEMAVAFAHQVMESASRARDAGAEMAHELGDRAHETADKLGHSASETAESARISAREIGRSIARTISRH